MLVRLVMAVAVISAPAAAEEEVLSLEEGAPAEELPPIEAKSYDLKIIRPSRSGRVYLLEKFDREMPDLGRIFLLREGNTSIMAFRVLKLYPEAAQIAAKKVREYPGYETLAPDSVYRAYEKIGDILTVPPQTREDAADLQDLEGGPQQPLTEEPPAEPGPEEPAPEEPAPEEIPAEEPPAEEKPAEQPAEEPDEGEESVEIDESAFKEAGTIDYFPNWLSLEFGTVRSHNIPSSTYQKALGLTYGRNLAHNIFMSSADYPDLITADLGFFYYKTNALVGGVAQSYTMLPIKGMLRYTRPTSESFSLYVYGGFLYNSIVGQVNVSDEEIATINGFLPAIGAGGLIQFGPNWYIKINLGLDTLGAGIVLRF